MSFPSEYLEMLKRKTRSQLPNLQQLVVRPISDSDFSRALSSNWRNRGDLFIDNTDVLRPQYLLVQECFRVWLCDHLALDRDGFPLYVELSFPDSPGNNPKHFARRFFSEITKPDQVMQTIVNEISALALRPVYIPADFAHPRGWFFDQLLKRPEHRKALAVAFFGSRNPFFCRHCIRSFLKTVSWNKEHILYPFPMCISIRGFMGGKCANCIWHSAPCEWELLSGYQPKHATEGPLDWPLQGKDCPPSSPVYSMDQLSPQSCPRVSCEIWLSFRRWTARPPRRLSHFNAR